MSVWRGRTDADDCMLCAEDLEEREQIRANMMSPSKNLLQTPGFKSGDCNTLNSGLEKHRGFFYKQIAFLFVLGILGF